MVEVKTERERRQKDVIENVITFLAVSFVKQ